MPSTRMLPEVGVGKAGDQLEQGGLAATGRTDQADKFSLGDGEVDVLEHRWVAPISLADGGEGDCGLAIPHS